jgi:hypothetical protein
VPLFFRAPILGFGTIGDHLPSPPAQQKQHARCVRPQGGVAFPHRRDNPQSTANYSLKRIELQMKKRSLWGNISAAKHPSINFAVKCLGHENANEIC